MITLLKNPNINFLGVRKLAFALSGAIIIVGIVSLITHKGLNYGIDFTGGTLCEIHFAQEILVVDIRAALANIGLENSVIQEVKETKYNFLIRTQGTIGEDIGKKIKSAFSKPNIPQIERVEMVGPSISRNLQQKALLVVLLGMIVMLIYVSIRFTFRLGVGAVVALIHDVIITIGVLSLFNKEFTSSIIAALLTIIGYSINDSIVLSDRIRENTKAMRGKVFEDIANTSINQTLSRTIITSLTTLFVVTALFIFGGRVIHDFAFALLVGIIAGTYSSIYILSALVVEWERVSPSPIYKKKK